MNEAQRALAHRFFSQLAAELQLERTHFQNPLLGQIVYYHRDGWYLTGEAGVSSAMTPYRDTLGVSLCGMVYNPATDTAEHLTLHNCPRNEVWLESPLTEAGLPDLVRRVQTQLVPALQSHTARLQALWRRQAETRQAYDHAREVLGIPLGKLETTRQLGHGIAADILLARYAEGRLSLNLEFKGLSLDQVSTLLESAASLGNPQMASTPGTTLPAPETPARGFHGLDVSPAELYEAHQKGLERQKEQAMTEIFTRVNAALVAAVSALREGLDVVPLRVALADKRLSDVELAAARLCDMGYTAHAEQRTADDDSAPSLDLVLTPTLPRS